MAGMLLDSNAVVICQHNGQAKPLLMNPQVKFSSSPAVNQLSPYIITGCSNPPEAGGPCISAQWNTAAMRVFVAGVPVVLNSSQAITVPPGREIIVVNTQQRVQGQ